MLITMTLNGKKVADDVAMGTMPLDPHLKSGAWRELTNDEIAYLQDIAADVQDGAIPHN